MKKDKGPVRANEFVIVNYAKHDKRIEVTGSAPTGLDCELVDPVFLYNPIQHRVLADPFAF